MQSLFTSINIFTYFWTLNYYRFEFILESEQKDEKAESVMYVMATP